MIKTLIILLVSFSLLSGCDQKHPCINTHINPVFIGFALPDIDTIILRAYKPNDNYQQLIDTFLVRNLHATIYTTSHDSTIVYVNDSDPGHWISQGFDWQIYIPAKNRTISISNINSPQTEGEGRTCYNPVSSFILDSQLILPQLAETAQFYTSGYMAYIHY